MNTIEKIFNLAIKNHQEGKTDIAQELYNQVLKINPNHSQTLNNIAVIFTNSKDYQKAISSYEKAIEINPNFADAHYNLGVIFMKLKDYQKAKDCYEKAIEINPNYAKAYYNQGNTYSELGDYQKALDCYDKAIKINPNYSVTHNNLGNIFQKLGDLQKAKDCFEKAIEINPNYVDAHNNLGVISKELGEDQKAKDCFEKAIEIDSNFAHAHNNLGNVFKDSGNPQKAISCYEKAIEIDSNFAHAHNNLGNVFQKLGNPQKAISCFEKAIEINPNYVDAHNNLGVISKELGEDQKAKSCYEKAIEIDSNFAHAHNNLGNVFKDSGNPQKAISCYEKAIEIDPKHIDAHYNLGIALIMTRQYKNATEHFKLINYKNSKSFLLQCLYKIEDKSIFFKELDYLIKQGESNPLIGSLISRSEIRYKIKKLNPFCGDPLKYILITNLTEEYNFKNIFVEPIKSALKEDMFSTKSQGLLKNGYQTAGNIFAKKNDFFDKIKDIIHLQIKKYQDLFKESNEGLIKNWPKSYDIYAWLVNMKTGGKLAPHIHEFGWLSGSIYINVPPKLEADSGNLVVCINDQVSESENKINPKKTIDVVTGSLCLFPSSLYHYTIPFESKEERIVLAFDAKPNYLK